MLFSVVVPVYNVEKYLEECLDSIVSQAVSIEEGCEIILVDDGSTDSSGAICDRYHEKYPELVKVFHNTNHGLLYTRRFGYKRTAGKYIVNCDSDDKLERYALKKLHKTIREYNEPDVIIFNYYIFNAEFKKEEYSNIFSELKVTSVGKKEVLSEFIQGHRVASNCTKCYKQNCLDKYKDYTDYLSIGNGEDSLQSIEIYNNAESYVYINEPLYDYRIGSGMTQKYDSQYYFKFKTIIQLIQRQNSNWKINEFDVLLASKVLEVTGRAITQSRYNHWKSYGEQIAYLKKIASDEIFLANIKYLEKAKASLQKDHIVLLYLLKKKQYIVIAFMLRIKNFMSKKNNNNTGNASK